MNKEKKVIDLQKQNSRNNEYYKIHHDSLRFDKH